MITLQLFQANDAWAFVFHREDEPVWKGAPIALAGYRMFFPSRSAAEAAAKGCGLVVGIGGVCEVRKLARFKVVTRPSSWAKQIQRREYAGND